MVSVGCVITRPHASGALGALACLLLTACTPDAPEPDQPTAAPTQTPPTYNYVALGDSYAALGSVSAAVTGPEMCQRSADNYPARLLSEARITGQDVSCAGAVTEDVLSAGGVPAQLDTLTTDTDLVTLSIGGNDIGFGDIVGCFFQSMNSGRTSNCVEAGTGPTSDRLGELPDRLDLIHREIEERTDGARVIVTGYLPMIATGDDCTELTSISPADREWVIDLTGELNRVVGEAAERNGAEMVLPADAGQHTGCVPPEQRWVDFFGSATGAYPMHPTAAGQAAMAQAVLAELSDRP